MPERSKLSYRSGAAASVPVLDPVTASLTLGASVLSTAASAANTPAQKVDSRQDDELLLDQPPNSLLRVNN